MVLTFQQEPKNSEIQKIEVEFDELEDSKVEKRDMEKNKAEESDHFETVTKYLKLPLFSCKCDQFLLPTPCDHLLIQIVQT